MQENESVFQVGDHLFRVGDEVGRQVAAVELHAFDDFELGFGVLAFFTVMTPSLPTFCIASAMSRPICFSPFAEIVPTWATSSRC